MIQHDAPDAHLPPLTVARADRLRALTADHHYRDSTDPRGRVALGPLALVCLARDIGFVVDTTSPYLPKHLVEASWYGEFDT